MLRVIGFAASLLALSCTALKADTPQPALPPLTLEECVARALDKNFDLKIQQFGTENARQSLIIARSTFDPSLQVTSKKSYSRQPSSYSYVDSFGNIVSSTNPTSDTDASTIGITQKIATGATITASGNLGRSRDNPQQYALNPAYNSDVALTVRQPLLAGAGVTVNRGAINRAKLDVTRAQLDFKGSVLTVVRNVETAYYNLGYAREQLRVYAFSLEVAQKLLEENRSRRETGVATDLEVLQAEVSVATARRNVLLATQDVSNREDALLALINPFGFNTSLGSVALSDDIVPNVSLETSYRLARDNTPDYASAEAALQQYKIDADIAKQNRLPTLDVGGTVGYSALQNSYGNAASRVWDGRGYNWQVDATLTIPWGMHADRARYRQAVLSLNREQTVLQQIDQNILVQVRSAVRAVQTNQEGVQISKLATQLSQRQFELEKARYETGVSTFRRVQESQADYDTARVNELQSRVSLRNALADLARLEGSSLARYHIKLDQ